MADLMPDYAVQQYKLVEQIAQLEFNKARYRREILEFRSRVKQAQDNIKATEEALADIKGRLNSLIEEHGEAPELEG